MLHGLDLEAWDLEASQWEHSEVEDSEDFVLHHVSEFHGNAASKLMANDVELL